MEGFLVSARKYRPLKWEDVIGQEHITKTLKYSLIKNQVSHAFLFCGPRGVGKTTCARILARVMNCEQPTSEWEPCNQCKTCKTFQENNSFNIFEIDAASNNSVEDIRSLVEQVRYQPQQGKFKIYIIDEVHMLSTSAFNAFLKTLEEPPPYVKFILATTEKHKIIPTILSRCQVYDFKRISIKDIIQQLEIICKAESIKAEPEALYQIAVKADGAMRDGLSIFDRIRSYTGQEITFQSVLENLNILDYDYFFKFFDAFITENTTEAFLLFEQVISFGFDPEVLLEGLANHARNLLICKNPSMAALFEGSESSRNRYLEQAHNASLSLIMSSLDMINEAEVNISKSKNRRLHVEVLLMKLSQWQRRISSPINITQTDSSTKPIETKSRQKNIPATTIEIPQAIPSESKTISVKPPLDKKLTGSIPTLASLDVIKQKINLNEQSRIEMLIELNEENFTAYWNKTIQSQKSKTLQDYMRSAKLEVQSNQVVIWVGSILGLESIRGELRIDEEIKHVFKGDKIGIKVEIDPELSSREEVVKPKKLYSAKEKWDIMMQVNPMLEEFQKILDLKIGED